MSQVDDTRLIPLTQGKFAIVDAVDYERIGKVKWFAVRNPSGIWYANRNAPVVNGVRGGFIYMHREVLMVSDLVDHIDGDGLNNRKSNLRLANKSQNGANKPWPLGVAGFRGVSRNKKRWKAQVMFYGRVHHIGTYDTPEEAARAWDAAAKEFHGEFAWLNFPE